MGWLELMARVRAMNRLMRGSEPDPGKWTEASRENFSELDEMRRKMRGQ